MKITEQQLLDIVNKSIEKSIPSKNDIEKMLSDFSSDEGSIDYYKMILSVVSYSKNYTNHLVYSSLKSILEELNLLTSSTKSERE